jgi:hypothetical protein
MPGQKQTTYVALDRSRLKTLICCRWHTAKTSGKLSTPSSKAFIRAMMERTAKTEKLFSVSALLYMSCACTIKLCSLLYIYYIHVCRSMYVCTHIHIHTTYTTYIYMYMYIQVLHTTCLKVSYVLPSRITCVHIHENKT